MSRDKNTPQEREKNGLCRWPAERSDLTETDCSKTSSPQTQHISHPSEYMHDIICKSLYWSRKTREDEVGTNNMHKQQQINSY